ncbi:sensor domain-containing diguanylate cyclase [Cohnella sp. WQ 127256]|uniref:sensor domain-containing diguanylate cyclase n=1 Tax=Cohnella sp. WQ 127256 TaxID=2938790 RepID=UPI0021197E1A|nr:sensor domain-containing diguanylate cyclase [Cohnella sp. WQ 127256]
MVPLEFAIAALIILAGSISRFYLPLIWNKLLLCVVLIVIVIAVSRQDTGQYTLILNVLCVLLASYSFSWYGAISSICLVTGLIFVNDELHWNFILGLLLAGGAGTFIYTKNKQKHAASTEWVSQLYKQSRQLSILKDIGFAIQSTMEVEKLLHIILTAITAGYGLGFNRALLFLMDEQGTRLKGEVGIGSMSVKEGISTWNSVVQRRMNLGDFIAVKKEAQFRDERLINLLRGIEIPMDSSAHVFRQVQTNKRPYIVNTIDDQDPVQMRLAEMFGMSSFAVVPMLTQGKMLGAIIVDNNVNHHPLDMEEIDSIIPLASQASVAIENSRLYEKMQQMSITDGLTGLYNQRYYQETLNKLLVEADAGCELSLIIADIDFFKHYNDTNGHLEGNNALIDLAKIMTKSVQGAQVPCRFGGEEFVVLLPYVTSDEALIVAEKIRSAVETHAFNNGKAQPMGKLTVSVGLASYVPGMSMQQLQDNADTALYEAKRTGKNRVVVHRGGGS